MSVASVESISFQTSRSILVLVCWLELSPPLPPLPLPPPEPPFVPPPDEPPPVALAPAGLGVAPDTSEVICFTEGSARISNTRVTSRSIVTLPSWYDQSQSKRWAT